MAHDHALPFSSTFQQVNQAVQTPLNALLLLVVTELAIGTTQFINAVLGITIDWCQALSFSEVTMLSRLSSVWVELQFSSDT